jgi:hypothetical protein
MESGMVITSADGTIADDMIGITTGVMLALIIVAIIISRRFGRTSKMSERPGRTFTKTAKTYGRTIRS